MENKNQKSLTRKQECIDNLKAYLGMKPYENHISRGSGMFLDWLNKKYGSTLVDECLTELKKGIQYKISKSQQKTMKKIVDGIISTQCNRSSDEVINEVIKSLYEGKK